MKKLSILSASLLSVMALQAQNPASPVILPDWGVYAITPNGAYAGGISFSAKIYNLETGQITNVGEVKNGLGNYMSNNGSMVGESESGTPQVYINGKLQMPETLGKFWFVNINAIAPDDSRLCGTVNNTTGTGLDYVPFYCDINEDGTVGEAIILPYPLEDFTGRTPQFATALWISEDGKTILGVVNDSYGDYDYPIIYTQDESGNWDYSLPTKDLFNPRHLEFPPNPWADEPPYPNYTDYMSPAARTAYELAMEQMSVTGIIPEPADYLTPEQLEEYNEAAEIYNEWYYANEANVNAYVKFYYDVIAESYTFPLNELTLSPDGTKFVSTSTKAILNGPANQVMGVQYYIYIYDLETETGTFIDSPSEWIQPHQILNDGTVLASYPINSTFSRLPTDTFIITPGAEEVIPIVDYWAENNPEYAAWVEENVNGIAGYVLTDSDMSVFIGSLDEFHFTSMSGPFAGMAAAAYIFGVDNAGVESIVADADGYKVYNLQGVNVMTTKDKNELSQLPAGIYIINGKKTLISK